MFFWIFAVLNRFFKHLIQTISAINNVFIRIKDFVCVCVCMCACVEKHFLNDCKLYNIQYII